MIKTTILIVTPVIMLYLFLRTPKTQRKDLVTLFTVISLGIFLFIILPGFRVTTIYEHCTEATELEFEDLSNAYILDKSIEYIHEKTSPENKNINGKFELCFGERCTKGYYYHFRPKRVKSNRIKLTGKMREISPKLLLSAFVDTRRHIEAIIDGKRVWIRSGTIEHDFINVDNNKSLNFYKWKSIKPLKYKLDNLDVSKSDNINKPITRGIFECPSSHQKVLDWGLSW